MKTFIRIALFFAAPILLIAANLEKTAFLSDRSKVIYHTSEEKVLDGPFALSMPNGNLSLRGVYKNNERSGNWYCFNPDGSTFLRYNYDQKKLVYLDTAAITRVKFNVIGLAPELKKDASVPVPICSIEQYISLLGTEIQRKIFAQNKSAEGTIDVDLIANVNDKGKAYYSGHYVVDGVDVEQKITINEKPFDLDWIPASYKGKKYASTFAVKMRFTLTQDPTVRQRFIWNY